jgi:hypothetical protein
VLSVAAYCFGRGLMPAGVNCDTPSCMNRPYSQDPRAFWILVPGAFIGLLGVLQIWLSRRCSSPPNRKVLRLSFLFSAIASVEVCLTAALTGTGGLDVITLLVAFSSVVFLCLGVALSLLNIGWSLARQK